MEKNAKDSFNNLFEIIKKLRGDGGCAWDREQTPESMTSHLLEETYEAIDAIEEKESEHVKEELGDVILNIIMIAYMYEEENKFSVSQMLCSVCEKLIRRHPHIFGNDKEREKKLSSDEVLSQWNKIKRDVEKKGAPTSILDNMPHLSPLLNALKLKKRTAKVGFDWDKLDDVMVKLDEEIGEIKEAIKNNDKVNMEEEIGDAFFVLVNVADKLDINPELALNNANKKFEKRFRYVESRMKEANIELKKENVTKMDVYWEEIKKIEHSTK